MNLLELNEKLLVGKKKAVKVPKITDSHLTEFKSLLAISRNMSSNFEVLEDANAFFKMFPDVKKLIGAKLCVEVFYACKLGYMYEGIPNKLLYILTKALNQNNREFVNLALNSAVNLLKPYADSSFTCGEEVVTTKDVIENIVGHSVQLITSSTPKVKLRGYYEVYIPNVERIALFPIDIGDMLSYADCERLSFDIGKGIMLDDVPVRILNNRIGVTKDDFDLRDCI